MSVEQFIIANSNDMEAEYGCRSSEPVTIVEMFDGEIFSYYGSETIQSAKQKLINEGVSKEQISYL